ncbi:MAG: hypothetical protein U0939_17815 [Pirellulales bacterium]
MCFAGCDDYLVLYRGPHVQAARAALLGQMQAPHDQALLLAAKNSAASPIVLTDAQVAKAVELACPSAVAQVINYTATARRSTASPKRPA